jgi:hypothetical protein
MALLYGRAGCLTAQRGGFLPGQFVGGVSNALAVPEQRVRLVEIESSPPAAPCWLGGGCFVVRFELRPSAVKSCSRPPVCLLSAENP